LKNAVITKGHLSGGLCSDACCFAKVVALVRRESIEQIFEVGEWHKARQPRENRLAVIHDLASSAKKIDGDTRRNYAFI
jgi:hypothetical protein